MKPTTNAPSAPKQVRPPVFLTKEEIAAQYEGSVPSWKDQEKIYLGDLIAASVDLPIEIKNVVLTPSLLHWQVPTTDLLTLIGCFVMADYGDETPEMCYRNAAHLTIQPEMRTLGGWAVNAVYPCVGVAVRACLQSTGTLTLWVDRNWDIEAKRPIIPKPVGGGAFVIGATQPDPKLVAERKKAESKGTKPDGILCRGDIDRPEFSKGDPPTIDQVKDIVADVFGSNLNPADK